MSEDTTAVSPELTADEKAQLESLQAKEREAAAAKAAEEAEEARLKQEEEDERIAHRPLFHVLVRHAARSPRTRTMRAARAGHRRQGAILDNGIRIRKRGRRRYTELDLRELVTEHERLLEYVRVGTLEVCDPKSEEVIPYNDLVKMIGQVAAWLEDHKAHQAEKMYAKEMEDYESAMEVYKEKLSAWEDAHKEYEKAEKEHKKAVSKLKEGEEAPEFTAKPPSAKPVEPEKPEKPEIEKEVMEVNDPSEGQDSLPDSVHSDVTRPDMGEGAAIAAVDQHEAEMTGEANTSDDEDEGADSDLEEEESEEEENGNGLTEEELMKMTRPELNEAALEYGVEDPESYSSKQAVVDAIFELQNGEE